MEVDQTTMKFIHLARQMEAFFLQKRFLLSALKPELVLKEENLDLRYEIQRKDELIRKHYEKIDQWKSLLMDQQPVSVQRNGGMLNGHSLSRCFLHHGKILFSTLCLLFVDNAAGKCRDAGKQ